MLRGIKIYTFNKLYSKDTFTVSWNNNGQTYDLPNENKNDFWFSIDVKYKDQLVSVRERQTFY